MTAQPSITGVAIDFDGTLAHTFPWHRRAWSQALEELVEGPVEPLEATITSNIYRGRAGVDVFTSTCLEKTQQVKLRQRKDELWNQQFGQKINSDRRSGCSKKRGRWSGGAINNSCWLSQAADDNTSSRISSSVAGRSNTSRRLLPTNNSKGGNRTRRCLRPWPKGWMSSRKN